MDYSENKDISAMCEVYKAEVEALRKALKEQGDWSDKGKKVNVNTDRTESTIELVEKIEELNGWLNLKTDRIARLEELLTECAEWLSYIDRDNGLVAKIDKILGVQQ